MACGGGMQTNSQGTTPPADTATIESYADAEKLPEKPTCSIAGEILDLPVLSIETLCACSRRLGDLYDA